MTAEENRGVEILRICQLAPGDKFMMNGIWLEVVDNKGKNLKCKHVGEYKAAPRTVLGSKSQQFVQVERNQK